MRFLRCLLLILLAIDLPGFGSAFALVPACAMQQGPSASHTMPAQNAQASRNDTGAHHCCADNSSRGDKASGTSCQDGMQCQCGALYQTVQPLLATTVPVASTLETTSSKRPLAAIAAPHWRPPTTV